MGNTSYYPQVVLKAGRESAVIRRHPWVFSGALAERGSPRRAGRGKAAAGVPEAGGLTDGQLVEILSSSGEYLATGHYFNSSIAVKILSFRQRRIDRDFWLEAIGKAVDLRKFLGLLGSSTTTAYRLVNGEGDLLPGLIADRYGKVVVIQLQQSGLRQHRDDIATAIKQLLGQDSELYFKTASGSETEPSEINAISSATLEPGQDSARDIVISDSNVVIENSHRFLVDWVRGQKTGFFLDQRDNRQLLSSYAEGKEVLNAFCYTGGFSVYALAGGARRVVSVDSSSGALLMLKRNLALNFSSSKIENTHEAIQEDCFDYLKGIAGLFDLIVLDPPAFAKHKKAIDGARRGYEAINHAAISAVRSSGMIFTFSCSQLIDRDHFRDIISVATAKSKRVVRILHQLTAAPCHPIQPGHREGEYLKGLVLFVE